MQFFIIVELGVKYYIITSHLDIAVSLNLSRILKTL
jgi:hypothetical protein